MTTVFEYGPFHPERPGIRKVLGDLEAEIMEIIWARRADQGTTVREVFEVLYERRHLAYTTVMNTMTRLAKKRLLRTEKLDTAYVYFPILTQEAFISGFVGRILDDLLVNFSGVALERLAAFSDAQQATRAQDTLDEISRRRAAAIGTSPQAAEETPGTGQRGGRRAEGKPTAPDQRAPGKGQPK